MNSFKVIFFTYINKNNKQKSLDCLICTKCLLIITRLINISMNRCDIGLLVCCFHVEEKERTHLNDFFGNCEEPCSSLVFVLFLVWSIFNAGVLCGDFHYDFYWIPFTAYRQECSYRTTHDFAFCNWYLFCLLFFF